MNEDDEIYRVTGGYRPTFIRPPGGPVTHQRTLTVRKACPSADIILMHGDDNPDSPGIHWWSAKDSELGPNHPEFPLVYKALFDWEKPDTSKTLVVSPYDTMRSRFCNSDNCDREDCNNPELAIKHRATRKYVRYNCDEVADVFGIAIFADCHRLRNTQTQTYWTMACLDVPFIWFLSATPMLNATIVSSCLLLTSPPCESFFPTAHSRRPVHWIEEKAFAAPRILETMTLLSHIY